MCIRTLMMMELYVGREIGLSEKRLVERLGGKNEEGRYLRGD